MGYGFFEPGERIINLEASEQAMIDIAVGLTLEGKTVFVYAITPHLFRAFEGIRIYLSKEQVPVKLVGVGRDRDYGNLGFTHWGEDADKIFKTLNIACYYPENESNLSSFLNFLLLNNAPSFLNLPR